MSKRVLSFDNKIIKNANAKNIENYINQIDEIINNKINLFC